jgi:two-component system sensor histidine kinase ChiS
MKSRVLVVDDNPDSVMVLRTILESNHFEVTTAGSGSEALGLLKGDTFDAVLLDVMMPDMSGLEVLERIRETPAVARIPVILVTAKTQDEDVLDGYQQGADYYITKPCTAKQLVYGLQMVLGKPGSSATSTREPDGLA